MYTIDVPAQPNVPIDPEATESMELPMPSNPFGAQASQLMDESNWTPPLPKTLSHEIGDRIVKLFTTAQARRELKRAYRMQAKRGHHYENLRA